MTWNPSLIFSIRRQALVVTAPMAVIGLAHPQSQASIHVLGQYQRQHAIVLRDKHNYWIGPHPRRESWVSLGERQVKYFAPLLASKAEVLGRIGGPSELTKRDYAIDIDAAVDRISQIRSLENLPRRVRHGWGLEVHIIEDRCSRLTPYWRD